MLEIDVLQPMPEETPAKLLWRVDSPGTSPVEIAVPNLLQQVVFTCVLRNGMTSGRHCRAAPQLAFIRSVVDRVNLFSESVVERWFSSDVIGTQALTQS